MPNCSCSRTRLTHVHRATIYSCGLSDVQNEAIVLESVQHFLKQNRNTSIGYFSVHSVLHSFICLRFSTLQLTLTRKLCFPQPFLHKMSQNDNFKPLTGLPKNPVLTSTLSQSFNHLLTIYPHTTSDKKRDHHYNVKKVEPREF